MESKEIETQLEELIAMVRSSTRIKVPEWAHWLLDDANVGQQWVSNFQVFAHGFNALRVELYVRSADELQLSFYTPDGQRFAHVALER